MYSRGGDWPETLSSETDELIWTPLSLFLSDVPCGVHGDTCRIRTHNHHSSLIPDVLMGNKIVFMRAHGAAWIWLAPMTRTCALLAPASAPALATSRPPPFGAEYDPLRAKQSPPVTLPTEWLSSASSTENAPTTSPMLDSFTDPASSAVRSDSEDDREEGRVDAPGAVKITSAREGDNSCIILAFVSVLGFPVR